MTLNRAITSLSVRSIDEETRVIRGWATTPRIDHTNEVIEPLGVRFRNPTVMLHQHKHDAPVAVVTFEKPTPEGVRFEAKFPVIDQPGPLRDRVETAYQECRAGLVTSVSVGFMPHPDKIEPMPGGGRRYREITVVELSLVSVPANPDAVLDYVKAPGGTAAARDSQGRTLWTDEQAKAWGWAPKKPKTALDCRLDMIEADLRAVSMGIDINPKSKREARVVRLNDSPAGKKASRVVRLSDPPAGSVPGSKGQPVYYRNPKLSDALRENQRTAEDKKRGVVRIGKPRNR